MTSEVARNCSDGEICSVHTIRFPHSEKTIYNEDCFASEDSRRARRRGAWRNGAGVCGDFRCRRSSIKDLERKESREPGRAIGRRSTQGSPRRWNGNLWIHCAMTIARLEWRSFRHDRGPGPAEEEDKKLKAGSGSDATYR